MQVESANQNIKFSQIKALRNFCESLDSSPDWKDVLQNMLDAEDDFEVNNVRFISEDNIDEILADELENDEYCLGCFSTWTLSVATGISSSVFEALQKAEAHAAIGKLVIDLDKVSDLAQILVQHDGYGHHFNHHDFGEEEIIFNGVNYYVFDNR